MLILYSEPESGHGLLQQNDGLFGREFNWSLLYGQPHPTEHVQRGHQADYHDQLHEHDQRFVCGIPQLQSAAGSPIPQFSIQTSDLWHGSPSGEKRGTPTE